MKNNLQIKFNGSPNPTLGVELELFTLNKETLSLTDGAPKILNNFKDNFFLNKSFYSVLLKLLQMFVIM